MNTQIAFLRVADKSGSVVMPYNNTPAPLEYAKDCDNKACFAVINQESSYLTVPVMIDITSTGAVTISTDLYGSEITLALVDPNHQDTTNAWVFRQSSGD